MTGLRQATDRAYHRADVSKLPSFVEGAQAIGSAGCDTGARC